MEEFGIKRTMARSMLKEEAYRVTRTEAGISILTENEDMAGTMYFEAKAQQLREYEGTVTMIFTQERNGVQLAVKIMEGRSGFSEELWAQVDFDVQGGDSVKVFVVDGLSSGLDVNPVVLQ